VIHAHLVDPARSRNVALIDQRHEALRSPGRQHPLNVAGRPPVSTIG
jgi:hypothetical protein